ncbi:MAG: carboxypeptidase-like regulatory domain-containing protein, partial [Acidobacteriota bacterium]
LEEVVTANFSLEPGGGLSGVVTDAETGRPLPWQRLRLYSLDADDVYSAGASTDEDGSFRYQGLTAGRYVLEAGGSNGYVRQYWDGVSCLAVNCDRALGTPIEVTVGETAEGIDLALSQGLTLGGEVRDAGTGQPIPNGLLRLRAPDGTVVATGALDSLGVYRFEGLVPGTYWLGTETTAYINEAWPGVRCAYGTGCTASDGTPIVLGETSLDGFDFELDLGGTLEATLRDELSRETLEMTRIHLYDSAGAFLASTVDRTGGFIRAEGLPTGEYRAIGSTDDGLYAAELYAGADCPGGSETCGPVSAGTPITVVEGQETAIEFTLEPASGLCVASDQTLCLTGGRFALSATWRTQDGAEGAAVAAGLPGVDDSGTFYFFDAENTELVVKVIDACQDPFNRFWVFAGGLTNVQVELTVEDLVADKRVVYLNPLGSAFQPIQDTSSFPTCFAGVDPEPSTVLWKESSDLSGDRLRQASRAIDAERAAAPAGSPTSKATCAPSETALCLGAGGRFRVEAIWETYDGDTGSGIAMPFRRDTGFLRFFESSSFGNIELIVKVLDACGEPFDRFWVFAAGLTNVEVRLQVTDTVTGEVRVYLNPQDQPFQPIQDTAAFKTCP